MDAALAIIAEEHRAFDASLAAIVDRIQLVRTHRAEADPASFHRAISYIATFMDHFHHPKEDEFLFKAVRGRTRQLEDVIDHLQHDHRQAPGIFAELLRSLEGTGAGTEAALADFAQLFERYARSQVDHMRMENDEVVPVARNVLRLSDWIEIESAFTANRDPLFSALGGSGALPGPGGR